MILVGGLNFYLEADKGSIVTPVISRNDYTSRGLNLGI